MSVTVDCGEGKHDLCVGTGHTAYLFPQESRSHDEPPFNCGCRCHQLPSLDRLWALAELAYGSDGMRVLGWADDGVMLPMHQGIEAHNFTVYDRVQNSHEDEVLIVAIRVPHPDEMSLEDVIADNPNTPHEPVLHPDDAHCVVCGRPEESTLHDIWKATQ